MRKLLFTLIVSTSFSLCPAAVVYDNLGAASGGADPIGSFGPLYDSFSTGAAGLNLVDVWVKLVLPLQIPPDPSITVALYANSSTSPGALLWTIGSIDDSELSSALQDYEFTLSTPYALAANTRYWIGLSTTGNARWAWSEDLSGTGVAGEYFANSNGVYDNSGGPYQMQLNDGSNVPEPASLLMMGGALLALGLVRRKSTR